MGHNRTPTIDPRIPTMPGRSTSGFHQPGKHRVHHSYVTNGRFFFVFFCFFSLVDTCFFSSSTHKRFYSPSGTFWTYLLRPASCIHSYRASGSAFPLCSFLCSSFASNFANYRFRPRHVCKTITEGNIYLVPGIL